MRFIQSGLVVAFTLNALLLVACGGASTVDSTPPAAVSTQTIAPEEQIADIEVETKQVKLQGHVTYERVLFDKNSWSGLDYAQTVVLPARFVVVQAIDEANTILQETITDAAGFYLLNIDAKSSVRVRVLAELKSSGEAF